MSRRSRRPTSRAVSAGVAAALIFVFAGAARAERGEPQTLLASQATVRARAALLRRSDFPAGFVMKQVPDAASPYCRALDESDLTLTGEAEGRLFSSDRGFVESEAQ